MCAERIKRALERPHSRDERLSARVRSLLTGERPTEPRKVRRWRAVAPAAILEREALCELDAHELRMIELHIGPILHIARVATSIATSITTSITTFFRNASVA